MQTRRVILTVATAVAAALPREEVLARQLVFIDGWIRPLYTAAAVLFPGAKDRLQVLEENRERCKQIVAARNG